MFSQLTQLLTEIIPYTTGLLGWFTFWTTYWVISSILPYDEKSKKIIPSNSVIHVVARNTILSLPYSILFWYYVPDASIFIPGFLNLYIIRFLICLLLMDGWFYFIHRIFHHKWFYFLHKQHHEFNIPYPLVAVYCSPIEALICDVTAIGLGPSILKMQGLEIIIWMIFSSVHSLLLHSSFNYGLDHGTHHSKNICNFGLFSFFDRIMGTYKP